MPVIWRDFTAGLYLSGPREVAPDGTLRRATGIAQRKSGALRSRPGSRGVRDGLVHSLIRFNDERFYGVGGAFQRGTTTIKSGLSGERLRFVRMPPTSGTTDYLFVAGGGILFKVSPDFDVSDWGIDPPPDGMTATKASQESKSIETFEAAAGWTVTSDPSDGSNAVSDEATIKVAGTNSMQFHVLKDTTAYAVKTFAAIDLTTYASGAPSPDEDFILLWVHISRPQRVESVELHFSSGDTTFTNVFTKELLIEDTLSKKEKKKERGIGDLIPVRGQDAAFLAAEHSKPESLSIQEQIGITELIATNDTWTRLRLPKAVFAEQGTPSWANIQGIKVVVNTNYRGAVDVYFDAMTLVGSVGMVGDYQMLVTFLDPDTGSRSNANPTPVTVEDVERQGITLDNIPTSTGYYREIWRTVGNGGVFFLDTTIEDDSTTTVTLTNADYVGLYGNTENVLQDVVLPTDNLKPSATFSDAIGPHYGRIFWLDRANPGRVYYSPAGRAEAVAGFLDVADGDDPGRRLVRWNNAIYCITEGAIFEIVGNDEPFVARRVRGAPGCVLPDTVVPTPAGIAYRAQDGVRLFNGAYSQRIGYDALAPLFLEEATAGYEPLAGIAACWARDEYIIGDDDGLFALSLADQRWRAIGLSANALYYEDETDTILLALAGSGGVLGLEEADQVTDDGDAIPFAVEPGSQFVKNGMTAVVQRIWIEANTRGQDITPTLLLDGDEIAMPVLNTATQQTRAYTINRAGRIIGVRLEGELTQPVDLVAIEASVHVPGEG